jgi:hypothetical protein
MVTVTVDSYFVERVEYFKDPVTVELFYLHARQAIFRVRIGTGIYVVYVLVLWNLS